MQRRTLQDRNHIFTLKYKNTDDLKLDDFVKKGLEGNLKPHLECGELESGAVDTINQQTVNSELSKTNYTVLVVGSKRCHGCLQIEPHLEFL